ncbi:MAG: putative quinol monooxygenase [Pseudomonadota bacterium]
MSLTYLAEISPKPEHFNQARDAVLGITGRTRSEAGCLQFDLYCDHTQDRLFLLETWRDKGAFDWHHQQTYTQEVFEAYGDWLTKPPVLTQIVALGDA